MGIPINFTNGQLTSTDDGGNSAILPDSEGDFTLSGLGQDGRQITVSETRGEVTGARKAARSEITISGTCKLTASPDDFELLVQGLTAGFVSVVADIGDAIGTDMEFDCGHGAHVLTYDLEDVIITEISVTEGDPSTVSFSGRVLGPITKTDDDGAHILVSSR